MLACWLAAHSLAAAQAAKKMMTDKPLTVVMLAAAQAAKKTNYCKDFVKTELAAAQAAKKSGMKK